MVKRVTGKLVPSVHSMGQRKRGNYYFFVPTLGSPYHYKYYLFTCRKRQQPRKNNTKDNPDRLSTPQRPTREQILRDSPGRTTRRYERVTCITYIILIQSNKNIYLIVIKHTCAAVLVFYWERAVLHRLTPLLL